MIIHKRAAVPNDYLEVPQNKTTCISGVDILAGAMQEVQECHQAIQRRKSGSLMLLDRDWQCLWMHMQMVMKLY